MIKKKKKNKKEQLPFRLNILFFIVFLMFSALILQLGVVQILNGEAYQDEINRTIKDTTKIPVPRGKIYDRNHNVIVDNKPLYSITYTPPKGVQAEDRLKVAEELAKYISMFDEKDKDQKLKTITERNKKEYWYLKNEEEVKSRFTEEELADLEPSEEYKMLLDSIKKEEYEDLTLEEMEVILIKKELDKAYALTPQIVKNEDVTPEEYAKVSENLDKLPGINATTDWNREYPYGDVFKSLLGNITSQEQGIPAEQADYYLTRGYSRNDRVGKSGLEEQYEDLLRGTKEQIQHTTTKSGQVIDSKAIVEGERGKDLVLTIDMEFQERVDKIVRDELQTVLKNHPYQNRFLEDALAVAIDPTTGELLAVSGQHYNRDKKKFENSAYKALYDSHRPGSTVKGATVLAGYESGVIKPGQTFFDTPVKIAGTPPKGSYTSLGAVNDIDALRRSSNVYMFHIAMRMGGEFNYQHNKSISFDVNAFQDMRNYYNQFGLGVKTGIDFPYEATGYVGTEQRAGNLLDFAIGQYDTYTTLQLAQYVATIANDGYRVRPHFLKEVRHPNDSEEGLGPVIRRSNTEVLNRIDMDQKNIERVQEGFRQVFQSSGGTGVQYFGNKSYEAAGKTGTAENEIYEDGRKYNTENLALVGYAPVDQPEIAFAVIVPNLGKGTGNGINHKIGTGILDTYFEMKEDLADEENEETEE
ncbi:MAG TPA: penicillin-binding protein 2 [Bacillota bacterium]|nr:penicillin-binding protein 2 [Bacillota bacterium]